MVNAGAISPDVNGGAAVYDSHLKLLHAAGFEIDLLAVTWNEDSAFNKNDYEHLSMVREIKKLQIASQPPQRKFQRVFTAMTDPLKFEYSFINEINLKSLQEIVTQKSYTLVWCEWRWNAILYTQLNLSIPSIYAHHDWEYKLSKHKNKRTIKNRFHSFQKKRGEYILVKQFSGCVSGSHTEAQEITSIASKKALYLPTTYSPKETVKKTSNVSIVHLGGMGTTANRVGLHRFLDTCWEEIKEQHKELKLIVIGSLSQADETLIKKLKGTSIICKGFVEDLENELFFGDIHIIPWEYNTGTRTRLPLAFNYKQAVVATKASVEAFPEVIHDKNALLCETLNEMTSKIISLVKNSEKREQLCTNAKSTFLNSYTIEGQSSKLKQYIESII